MDVSRTLLFITVTMTTKFWYTCFRRHSYGSYQRAQKQSLLLSRFLSSLLMIHPAEIHVQPQALARLHTQLTAYLQKMNWTFTSRLQNNSARVVKAWNPTFSWKFCSSQFQQDLKCRRQKLLKWLSFLLSVKWLAFALPPLLPVQSPRLALLPFTSDYIPPLSFLILSLFLSFLSSAHLPSLKASSSLWFILFLFCFSLNTPAVSLHPFLSCPPLYPRSAVIMLFFVPSLLSLHYSLVMNIPLWNLVLSLFLPSCTLLIILTLFPAPLFTHFLSPFSLTSLLSPLSFFSI